MVKKDTKKVNNEVEEGKFCALLSYLLIGLVWFLADKKMNQNDFVKFHVKQGIVFLVVCVVLGAVSKIFLIVPVIGWIISTAVGIFTLVLLIVGIINSLNGNRKELPIIGGWSKKFTF